MIYDYIVTTGKGETLNLADYRGKVILVVNTATGCGFTPQISPATSSAGRPPERMTKSMSSAPCTSTPPSRR